jgi:CheY-like chemotaxis protein
MTFDITMQTILIVDDNPTNLEVLSETLVRNGFQVSVAIDGERLNRFDTSSQS